MTATSTGNFSTRRPVYSAAHSNSPSVVPVKLPTNPVYWVVSGTALRQFGNFFGRFYCIAGALFPLLCELTYLSPTFTMRKHCASSWRMDIFKVRAA